jgi:hypothetical protein
MAGKSTDRAGYRSALREPDFRRLLGSQLISASGSWAYNTALIVLLFELTHSAAWVAAGTVARFAPSVLVGSYAGVVAERFERVRLMVCINVGALLVQAGLAVAAWQRAPACVAIVLGALTAIVVSPYKPAVAALIPQVVGKENLAAANALNATINNLVTFLGPAIGAPLLIAGGPVLAITVNALSFGVAAFMVPRMNVRSQPADVSAGGRSGPLRQVADGFRAVAGSGRAATFVVFSVIVNLVSGADLVLFIPISRAQLGAGTSGYGYLLAGLGAGGVLGAGILNRLAAQTRLAPAIFGGLVLYCLPVALLVMVHHLAAGFALEVVRGAGLLVVDTLAITALQRSVPRDMVARVFGVFFTLAYGSASLGALITPAVLRAGLHPTMIIIGAAIPVACLPALPLLLRADQAAAATAAALAPRVASLEQLDLFRSPSPASLQALAQSAQEITVAAGTVVMAEGDPADAFYVLTEGEFDVSAVGEAGAAPARLRTLGPGSYAGEIGLLARMPRTATVSALVPCTLLRIAGEDFLSALTTMSASPSLIRNAQARMAVTHPSSQALAHSA